MSGARITPYGEGARGTRDLLTKAPSVKRKAPEKVPFFDLFDIGATSRGQGLAVARA